MKFLKLIPFIAVLIVSSQCAYYNTFFNAKKYFKDADKQREERLERERKQQQQGIENTRQDYSRPSTGEIKNYNLSIEKASKVLELYPDSKYIDDALFLLGKCFYRKQDYPKAERKFLELIDNFPDSDFVPEAKLWMSKTYVEMREYEVAEKTLHDILNQYAKHKVRDEAQFLLGGLFQHKKDYIRAVSEFETAAKRINDKAIRSQAYYQLGESYFELKNYKQAAESFKQARKYSTDVRSEFESMFQAALTYKKMEEYEEAIKILTNLLGKIVNEENWPACRLEIAHCHYLMGNTDLAIEWYQDIIEQHPKTVEAADAYYYLGNIYLEEKGEYLFAQEYFDKAPKENARAPMSAEARSKSQSIKQLLELKNNIVQQYKKIAAGDSIAAIMENLDPEDEKGDIPILQFSPFDTLVAKELFIPLDSLWVYQDTLMTLYEQRYKDYEYDPQPIQDDRFEEQQPVNLKPVPLDTLIAEAMKMPLNYLSDYQDSLKNMYDRYYPTYEKNKIIYDIYKQHSESSGNAQNIQKAESPQEALIQAKLSLAEIYLFDFNQPDSALDEYRDILELDTARTVVPKTLFSIGYIAETVKKDTVFADSIFQRLNSEFPDHPLADHARKKVKSIDIPDPDEKIAQIYKTAELAYLDQHEYEDALNIFWSIYNDYPASDYAPKSLMAMGYIYENDLAQLDSAYKKYQTIIADYPNSTYAQKIQKKVQEVKNKSSETEKESQEKPGSVELAERSQADEEFQQKAGEHLDIASMTKEEYRRWLRIEMQKNDPRRETPKRW